MSAVLSVLVITWAGALAPALVWVAVLIAGVFSENC